MEVLVKHWCGEDSHEGLIVFIFKSAGERGRGAKTGFRLKLVYNGRFNKRGG